MQVGIIGLGKIGQRALANLASKKIDAIGFDKNPDLRKELGKKINIASSIKEFVEYLKPERKIVLLVPAGEAVEKAILEILPYLKKGDIIADAGNSHYLDSIRRAKSLGEKGIFFLDAGTSGGLRGAENGLCFTVGGEKKAFEKFKPVFEALASKNGLLFAGGNGSGHFIKMAHNAIEYGILQSYAEGFELLSKSEFGFNLCEIAGTWNNGAIIRSYILELAEKALKEENFDNLPGIVEGGETGKWAIEEAWKKEIPFSSITAAFESRLRSRQENTFSNKFIAAIRNKFGGHKIPKSR
ncbi:MAG: decarboxylating 6-phosphogluconate dehydrogenase [Candidatus ainarchaeum sp.]|nr:decarboxylating 6-phosphogluconate dehydrogenase [Candidatus ainarchaeum sp.]